MTRHRRGPYRPEPTTTAPTHLELHGRHYWQLTDRARELITNILKTEAATWNHGPNRDHLQQLITHLGRP